MKRLLFSLGALALTLGAAQAQNFVRMEMLPIPSVTMTTQQVLAGDIAGAPVMIAGQLRIPKPGTDKLPAIIMVHGSGGLNAAADAWAREFNSIGVAVLVLDSFAGRNIVSTVTDQSQLDHLGMMVDAYRALGVLAQHPRIDASRVAVIGFSKGAVASVFSSMARFKQQLAPEGVAFAAHIGLYTPCNTAYRDNEKTTGKPIRLHHGIPDDWVTIGPCRDYVAKLKQAGVDIALAEYPDSYHAYDNAALTAPITFPQAQTTRGCALGEADGGKIVNVKTGKEFSYGDPCLELGARVAYNEAAHKATVASVKEFLAATFRLKE